MSLVDCDVNFEEDIFGLIGNQNHIQQQNLKKKGKTPYCFSVTPINPKNRTYIIYADNEQDMNQWVHQLRKQIEKWNMERIDRLSNKEGFVKLKNSKNFDHYLVLKDGEPYSGKILKFLGLYFHC